MELRISLSTNEKFALRKIAAEIGSSLEDAAKTVLRSWMIKNGYLDSAEADNDNEDEESRIKQ